MTTKDRPSVYVIYLYYLYFSLAVFVFSGLEVDGIYRVSGNLATIQKLRFIVDQGRFKKPFLTLFDWNC